MNPTPSPSTPSPSPPPQNLSLNPEASVDLAIQVVEGLYQSLTGRTPPPVNGHHAPMPPEVDPASHIERQLERLLGEINGPAATGTRWAPPLQAWEADGALVLAFDVPGIARDAIEVSLGSGSVIVSGERRHPWQQSARVLASEQPHGRFRRVIPLPPGARVEQLAATLRDGVLEVRVPIAASAQPQPVPVH